MCKSRLRASGGTKPDSLSSHSISTVWPVGIPCFFFWGGRCRNEATSFLKQAQGLQGFVEASFGRGRRAGDESEQTVGDPGIEIFRLEGAGFRFAKAAHAPEVLGQFIDEDLFGGAGGLVFTAKSRAEVVELGRILIREDELFGVQAVTEGVLGRADFAVDGFGSGGMLGIGAIACGVVIWLGWVIRFGWTICLGVAGLGGFLGFGGGWM